MLPNQPNTDTRHGNNDRSRGVKIEVNTGVNTVANTGVDVGEAWCGFCPPKRSEYLSEHCGEYLIDYCGELCCGFMFLLSLCMESSGEYCGEICNGFSSRPPCRGVGAQMLSPPCSRSRAEHSCWPPRHNPIESQLPLFPAETCLCNNRIQTKMKRLGPENPPRNSLCHGL